MDSLGMMMDNLAMSKTPTNAARQIESALELVVSGHFFDMPHHFMKRDRPADHLCWLVVGGRGYVVEAGRRYPVRAGDLITLLPGVPHEYGADPRDPWDIFWFHFQGQLAPYYAGLLRNGAAGTGGPVVQAGVDAALCERMADLVHVHEACGRHTPLQIHGELHAVLTRMIACIQRAARADDPATPLDDARIEAYIHSHLALPHTLDDLAQRTHLSVTQFSRLFRRRHHQSPMQYVLHARMSRAAAMLRETREKIVVIASQVGYDDPYYFSRLFRKTMGKSPAAFRAATH